MAGISLVQIHGYRTLLSPIEDSRAFLSPQPPENPRGSKVFPVRATYSEDERFHGRRNPLSAVIGVPKALWARTLRPLSDFGFGRRSVWEGGVGIFVVSGTVLLALCIAWLKGFRLRSSMRKYEAVFEFSQACGICTGTPVRIRGVNVGTVVRVNPSLKNIEAVVEIDDEKTVIPRNSFVEVNQSGLLMETLIDITPREPIPSPTAGPLDPDCHKEGMILCDREMLKGHQGVSLDALVGIFTRLGQEMEDIGVSKTYKLAEKVVIAIEEAKPLLAKIEAMAEDVQPLLSKVHDGDLLKNVENLTRSLAEASEELRSMHSSIVTADNTELLRESVSTLTFTLKNIESITNDISGFTGDEVTKHNLKLLIRSLSRLL